MAVTQQLARAAEETIARCRRDVDRLDDLCSFRLLPAVDHLDLDWAPALLEAVAGAAQLSASQIAAIHAATAGDHELNPAYRDAPDSVCEHPVSFLSPARVAQISNSLDSLPEARLLSETTVSAALIAVPEAMRPDGARGYVSIHLHALRRFYAGAARRGLATVMWWD